MVKDWGCDCVFFFNYGRINAGISNDAIRAHMDALFGQERIERMRGIVADMRPHEREPFVLEEFAAALRWTCLFHFFHRLFNNSICR